MPLAAAPPPDRCRNERQRRPPGGQHRRPIGDDWEATPRRHTSGGGGGGGCEKCGTQTIQWRRTCADAPGAAEDKIMQVNATIRCERRVNVVFRRRARARRGVYVCVFPTLLFESNYGDITSHVPSLPVMMAPGHARIQLLLFASTWIGVGAKVYDSNGENRRRLNHWRVAIILSIKRVTISLNNGPSQPLGAFGFTSSALRRCYSLALVTANLVFYKVIPPSRNIRYRTRIARRYGLIYVSFSAEFNLPRACSCLTCSSHIRWAGILESASAARKSPRVLHGSAYWGV